MAETSGLSGEHVVTSALCLLIPEEVSARIQAVRAIHAKGFSRWPAHINLLYPFIPQSEFEAAVPLLTRALSNVQPFDVRLDRYKVFEHRASCTLYLSPDEASTAALKELQRCLEAAFPWCNVQSVVGQEAEGSGYTPHCGVGDCDDRVTADLLLGQLQASWEPVSFRVSEIHVLAREKDGPFCLHWTIPLGTAASAPASAALRHDPPVPYRVVGAGVREQQKAESKAKAAAAAEQLSVDSKPRREARARRRGAGGSGSTLAARAEQLRFRPTPVFRYNEELKAWTVADSAKLPTTPVRELRVLSWNVLFDIYDKDRIHTKQRLPRVLSALEAAACRPGGVDIICLQEVEPSFLATLLALPWVQKHFFLSDAGSGGTVTPYGQLTLSRLPFRAYLHAFSQKKRCLVAEFSLSSSGDSGGSPLAPLVLANVHLSSNRTAAGDASGMDKRMAQLRTIYQLIAPQQEQEQEDAEACDGMIVGDFNFGDDEQGSEFALRSDFVDVWQSLHGSSPGFTYDPSANPTAAITTASGQPKRLDRVLVRSSALRPQSAELVGTEPFQVPGAGAGKEGKAAISLCPSDHYALSCTLSVHPPSAIADATSESSGAAAAADAKGGVGTVADASTIADAAKRTLANEPRDIVERKLTELGLVDASALSQQCDAVIATLKLALAPVFISPADEEGGAGKGKAKRERKGKDEEPFLLLPVGSHGMGIPTASSDLDVLCIGNLHQEDFFIACGRVLASCSLPGLALEHVLAGPDVLVPLARLSVHGLPVEVQYCAMPGRGLGRRFDPAQLGESEVRSLDLQSQLTFQALADCSLLRQAFPPGPLRKRFGLLLHAVKHWAKRQGLYNGRLGYLGGYSWTLLAAIICQRNPKATTHELVGLFFATLAHWPWQSTPLALADPLSGRPPSYRLEPRDAMAIVTLGRPHRNSARTVTPATRRVLTEAFARAAAAPTWEEMMRPLDFASAFRSFLQITVSAISRRDFLLWRNYVESRLAALLLSIGREAPRVALHPHGDAFAPPDPDAFPFAATFYIGLAVAADPSAPDASLDPRSRSPSPSSPSRGRAGSGSSRAASAGTSFQGAVDSFLSSLDEWYGKSAGMHAAIRHIRREKMPALLPFNMPQEEGEGEGQGEEQGDPSQLSLAPSPSLSSAAAAAAGAGAGSVSGRESSTGRGRRAEAGSRSPSPAAHGRDKGKGKGKGGGERKEDAGGKEKLTTSKDIFNRIKWDTRFDPNEFTVTYEDRFTGMQEKAFTSVRQQDDDWFPWHRVWQFKWKGEVMWDREKRIDKISQMD